MGERRGLLINNLHDSEKVEQFLNLLRDTYGFEMDIETQLSASEMEIKIKSIRDNYETETLRMFFLVIFSEKADARNICGIDNRAIIVPEMYGWINNHSMPRFQGIPRIMIYYGANDSGIHYGFNHAGHSAAMADMLIVFINDAKYGELCDCDAVCAALRRHSSGTKFCDIFRRIGCTVEYIRFDDFYLTPI